MSMGIVTFPDLGDTVADLTKKADIAMYEAKRSDSGYCSGEMITINSSPPTR